MGERFAGDVLNDNSRFIEERYEVKVSRTVLKSSGGGDLFTDFNHPESSFEYALSIAELGS